MKRAHLDEIFAFMAVVDAGSFVSGGRAIGLTRSAAGKALARLESRLGVRLLNRTTRHLSLTDDGRVFHEHCQQVLAALDDAEASVGDHTGTPRGVLRITVPDAFGRLHVLPVLKKYLQTWPDVQVEVSFTDRVADIIEEGYDLAVRINVTSTDTRLVSRLVAQHRVFVCAAPSYLAARGEPQTLEELATHDCLLFSSRARRQRWRLRPKGGAYVTVEGQSRLRLDSGEAIRDAAVAGLGIAFLPSFLVDEDLARGRLKALLPSCETEVVRIMAFYPSKRHLPAKVRRFIDLLVEQ
ncbi:transcriptional regulator, LysR family [Myxococcus xanthus DK 1622]|uniref:Transcriptional regulator, LysR family n=1 Tax=Myxococcus xanthus (strain DK1622) TaxID=246197 RepID=Q1D7L9_MYXXD|nr:MULTISPECIES: LysR family transcriptional regulator [Myxococcus]ABF92845.1 transcriptional regulator, LysR family [Myxococcus xanthus DK 1622]NOJ52914.1 LysR family transcriptional regulator [Myxococcus xanthus]QPM82605.1 LysR family transcriptional regulator [Myxococcus xanthus]QVW64910.1 LysR family transcriptional regulator [Myxococcus xanthus DZ2]QZZ50861.1 HTH-type transcriptional regulator PgrR [Myxococcus xanthus]